VYRDSYLSFGGRTGGENTVIFEPDGRFVFLKHAWMQGPLVPPGGGRVPLSPTEGDGRYMYRKTGSSSGEVDLSFDNGAAQTLRLTFATEETGTFSDPMALELVFQLTDTSALESAPATNVSMRGRVGPSGPLVVGFVVPGKAGQRTADRLSDPAATERDVLIRVVGPSLAAFGVTGVLRDPRFQIFSGAAPVPILEAIYDDWSIAPSDTLQVSPDATERAFKKIFDFCGAFPLFGGSKDAVALVRLAPGAYTVVASAPEGSESGEVLVEIYFLP